MRGLLAVVILMVLAAVVTLVWMAWRSPEIRDVPPTETRTPRPVAVFTVTPESLFRATATATMMPDVFTVGTATPRDLLPMTPSTRVPTSTPTVTATVVPTADKPAVQRGG